LKREEFLPSLPSLSLKVDWRGRERMRSSGLWCDVCVVYFKCIKEESGGFRVKFVKVCE